jgi:tRNA-splicing ligase RtcB
LGEESYICVGREESRAALYSANHGVGRVLDKDQARAEFDADSIAADLAARRIRLYKEGGDALAEQAPGSYKNVPMVIEAMQEFGLARLVARTRPLAILKG